MIIGGLNSLISSGSTSATQSPVSVLNSISGCVLWIEADQAVSPVNGQPITSINDLSPLNASYVQGNNSFPILWNASDPMFGHKPSIGSTNNGWLKDSALNNSPLAQPLTIYFCCYTTASIYTILMSDNADTSEFGFQVGGPGILYYTYNPEGLWGTTSVPLNTPLVMCCIYNGSSSAFYVNSSSTALSGPSGANPVSHFGSSIVLGYEGSADGLEGNYVLAAMFNGAHTQPQRAEVFSYLATKYSLSGVV